MFRGLGKNTLGPESGAPTASKRWEKKYCHVLGEQQFPIRGHPTRTFFFRIASFRTAFNLARADRLLSAFRSLGVADRSIQPSFRQNMIQLQPAAGEYWTS